MNKEELKVYNGAIKDKYKHYKLWKILAIVFMCITAVLAIAFIASGAIFTETTNVNNNDVEIINEGDSNTNNVVLG